MGSTVTQEIIRRTEAYRWKKKAIGQSHRYPKGKGNKTNICNGRQKAQDIDIVTLLKLFRLLVAQRWTKIQNNFRPDLFLSNSLFLLIHHLFFLHYPLGFS